MSIRTRRQRLAFSSVSNYDTGEIYGPISGSTVPGYPNGYYASSSEWAGWQAAQSAANYAYYNPPPFTPVYTAPPIAPPAPAPDPFSPSSSPGTGQIYGPISGSTVPGFPNGAYVDLATWQQWQQLQSAANVAVAAQNQAIIDAQAAAGINAPAPLVVQPLTPDVTAPPAIAPPPAEPASPFSPFPNFASGQIYGPISGSTVPSFPNGAYVTFEQFQQWQQMQSAAYAAQAEAYQAIIDAQAAAAINAPVDLPVPPLTPDVSAPPPAPDVSAPPAAAQPADPFSPSSSSATGQIYGPISGSTVPGFPNGAYVTLDVWQQWQQLQTAANQAVAAANQAIIDAQVSSGTNAPVTFVVQPETPAVTAPPAAAPETPPPTAEPASPFSSFSNSATGQIYGPISGSTVPGFPNGAYVDLATWQQWQQLQTAANQAVAAANQAIIDQQAQQGINEPAPLIVQPTTPDISETPPPASPPQETAEPMSPFSPVSNPITGQIYGPISGSTVPGFPNGAYVDLATWQQWQQLQSAANAAVAAQNQAIIQQQVQTGTNAPVDFVVQPQQPQVAPAPSASTPILVSSLDPQYGVMARLLFPGSVYITFAQFQQMQQLAYNIGFSQYAPAGGIGNLTADDIRAYLEAYPSQAIPFNFTLPNVSTAITQPTTTTSPATGAEIPIIPGQGLAPVDADGIPIGGGDGTPPSGDGSTTPPPPSNHAVIYAGIGIAAVLLIAFSSDSAHRRHS